MVELYIPMERIIFPRIHQGKQRVQQIMGDYGKKHLHPKIYLEKRPDLEPTIKI